MGFNTSKQKGTRAVKETAEFYEYLCGSWSEVSLNLITNDVTLATVSETMSSQSTTDPMFISLHSSLVTLA